MLAGPLQNICCTARLVNCRRQRAMHTLRASSALPSARTGVLARFARPFSFRKRQSVHLRSMATSASAENTDLSDCDPLNDERLPVTVRTQTAVPVL
jgi:hypothetical protein